MINKNELKFPFISIVVTVYNEQKTISNTLESLIRLDYPEYEIIIVDGGSKDTTRDIIKRYSQVKLIETSGCNISKGRNIGINHARGEIIAITDGDMVVEKNWLKELVTHYKYKKIGGVGGPNFTYVKDSLFMRALDVLPNNGPRYKEEEITNSNPYIIATRNASYRKKVLIEAGYFDEDLWVGEDPELNMRILNSGKLLKYTPNAIVYHNHRNSIISFFKQQYKYGIGTAFTHKKDINMLKTRPKQIIPPLAIILFITIIFLSFIYLPAFYILLFSIFIYFTALIVNTFLLYSNSENWGLFFWIYVPLILTIWYLAYSIGYLKGLFLSKYGFYRHKD